MSKHVPGPWKVTGRNGKFYQLGIGEAEKNHDSIGCVYGDTDSEIIRATARLIAAAPELQRMLDTTLDVFVPPGASLNAAQGDLLRSARALLARIDGDA